MSTKPLIKESLIMLKSCGMDPLTRNKWNDFKATVSVILLAFITIEIYLDAYWSWIDFESADSMLFIQCASNVQMQLKGTFMVIKRKEFAIILNHINEFWSWDNLPEEITLKIQRICKYAMRWIIFFSIVVFLCLMGCMLKPFFRDGPRTLPFGSFHPRDINASPNYEIMFFVDIVESVIGCIAMVGFDSLFISLTTHIICEFKILKQRFRDIKIDIYSTDETECLQEFGKLVEHHNYILEAIRAVDKLYSIFLLTQFSSSVICVCAPLLGMAVTEFPPDSERLFNCISFSTAASSQLLMYCVIGEIITAESESVSTAVYESDWWVKTQPKYRKSCVIVIQRAQKMEQLTAGGMVPLKLEIFTSIMNFALSFFTMARALHQVGENNAPVEES